MPLGLRPPWACGVGDLAAALATFSRRITDHGRTLPLRSHGWLAQEMVHPILTRMWRRRQPASLSKAILVAVNAWRLLHVQVHAAAKKSVIGRRLCIYWKDDSLWYCGIINDYDPKDDKHLVHYDDGVDEWLLLKEEIVHIFDSAEEVRLAACTPPRLAWSPPTHLLSPPVAPSRPTHPNRPPLPHPPPTAPLPH